MDRPIAQNEAEVIRWLLDHAPMCDVTSYRAHPIEALRVFDPRCACGCASLDFESAGRGWGNARIIADAVSIYPDGKEAGLILWGREGAIVLLEIYDLHPEANRRFPGIANLRAAR